MTVVSGLSPSIGEISQFTWSDIVIAILKLLRTKSKIKRALQAFDDVF